MQALELAFNMAPRHQGVRSTLGRLYARHERHEALLRLLEAEAELFEDPERRAATAFRSGDIYEKKLQQLETAAQAYERALEFRPAYRPAVSAVARVYALLERHEDLIALFEQQVAGSPDPEEKLVLLDHIAGIWDRTLRDPAAALSAYERVIAIAPTSLPAMHALRRLYAMGTRWHDLAGILRAEAEHTLDRWRRAAILSELAEVHERALGQRELALGACLEALQTVPQYQPALMMAGRLLADAGNFERLVELHRQELEVTEDAAHRVWILLKIGRLLLERLQRPEEALDVFVQAMQGADDPASVAADMVLRLARVRGDAALERKVLGAMPVPPSPRDRSMYHRQLGLLCWAEGLHQEAIKQLRLALVGPEDPALHELRSLLALQQDRRGLVELYEGALQQTDGVSAKLFILHRLGRLYGTMPHELHRAARAWEQVLDLSPRNPVALRQLETICGLLGRWDELVAVVELQRENSEDEDFRLGCALEVVALREDRLDDLPGAAQAAVEVLEKHPAHSEALATLERHARWSANADELLQVLGRQLKMAQTAAEQAALLLASAAVHANRDEMARACESYRLAIDVMPSYLPALRGWYRAAERLGDATQMARALELEARACKTPERQAACLYESARLWELRNDDVERAAKNYWRVLQIQPRHAETTRALSALLAMKMDFRQLVELIEHQLDHAEEPAEQRDLLARIADVQRSRLGDLGAARRTVSRALELFPGDRQLLSTLAELCRASEDYEALAQVNQRLVAVTSDPVLLKGLHFELGRLWEERLGEPERSVEAYRAVLRLDPNDLGALTHLCAVLRTLRDWAGAAEVTEKLAQRDNDRGRIKGYYLILAQIQADGFGRLDRAVEACRKALALDPGDAAATAVMADLLQRREDLRGLNAHLESTLAVHRARIDRDPFAVESYRALLRVFEWQNAVQRCEVVHCVLQAIGAAAPESRSVIARMSDERWARPARGITAEELVGVLVHPEERGSLRQVLLLVEPILRKLRLPKRVPRKAIKLSARAEDPVAVLARELAQTVGARDFHGYRYTSAPRGVFASDTVTPSLVFGGDCESIPPDDLRFLTARALANIALHHTPLTRLGAAELGKMLATILWIVCATFTPPHPRELLGEIRGTIEKLMSARLRARLEAPAIALTSRPFAPESWFEWFVQSEDRIALAATGDVIAALNVIVREETGKELGGMAPGELAERSGARTRHILSFAVSEEYLTLRERLSLALR